MLYLVLTILLFVLLVMIFRYYQKYDVDNLSAIVVNYFVCTIIGSLYAGKAPWMAFATNEAWLPYGLCIGTIFIGAFFILAITVQNFGIYFTTMVQKVSLVFTVVFAIVYFGDPMSLMRGLGVFFALLAIYLITRPDRDHVDAQKWSWPLILLPFVTFATNGVIDLLFFYLERSQIVMPGDALFSSFLFCTAGSLGLLAMLWRAKMGNLTLGRKEIIGGILLGIPNFYSIHFYLLAMGAIGGESVVPMTSVGSILCSAVAGYFFFQEKLTISNIVGMTLAIASILMLTLALQ